MSDSVSYHFGFQIGTKIVYVFGLVLELRLDEQFMSKSKWVHLEGCNLPSGSDQYFSLLGDQHFSVFLQTKGEFWWLHIDRHTQL